MAFNIFERWPWTSFQNLNLDWLMKAVKEALTTVSDVQTEVGTYSDRINSAAADAASAQTAAASAQTAAASAQTAAASAQTAAASAQTAADNAAATGQAAQQSANSAQTAAASAQTAADNAAATGQAAQQSANSAAAAAAAAQALAEKAVLYTPEEGRTEFEKAQARRNIAAGHYDVGVSEDETLLTLINLETNTVETYNINKGPSFLVTVSNPAPNVFQVNRTAAEIRANLHKLMLRYGLNEGVEINSYEIYGSPPLHNIRFVVVDPNTTSANYIEFILQLYQEGYVPADPEQDIVTVTRNLITHNIGGGSLPDTTSAAAGDFLRLDAQKNAIWETVPAAESNSFGGV